MPVPRPKSTRHRQNKPGKLSAGHTGAVEIGVALEAVKAVQHQDLVIIVVGDQLVQTKVVVAEVHHVDVGVIGGEVRHKAVGVAVLDDKDLSGAVTL